MSLLAATLRNVIKAVERRLLFTAASLHRRRLRTTTFVGITGSTGKTMTKDLVTQVLSLKGSCTSTPQGKNLRAQLARTILQTRAHHKYCVLEIATLTPGYMAPHVALVRPDIAVVTNIGRDHWRAFGSASAIADEKRSLVTALPADGVAILNADDPLVEAMQAYAGRSVTYGTSPSAAVRGTDPGGAWPERFSVTVTNGSESVRVQTRLLGQHWLEAVCAAMAVAVAEGVPLAAAAAAIAEVEPAPARMSVDEYSDGVTFVRDDAKASISTIGATLAFLRAARAKRKIAVFGTLSDYGGSAGPTYVRTARAALESAQLVMFVGPMSSLALRAREPGHDGRLLAFATVRDAARYLDTVLRDGDLVLVKGSNPADHLGRLSLARSRSVNCWRERCGRLIQCAECDLLSVPAGLPQETKGTDGTASLSNDAGPVDARTPLVVGLGNPGDEYVGSPHNVGYAVVDSLAERLGAAWRTTSSALYAPIEFQGHAMILVKLSAPMNHAGPALSALARSLSLEVHPHRTILVYDDLDLPLGKVRSRLRGSSGGHRGVASVMNELQSDAFPRVKVGVRPLTGERLKPEALVTPIAPDRLDLLLDAYRQAGDEILEFFTTSNRDKALRLELEPAQARELTSVRARSLRE